MTEYHVGCSGWSYKHWRGDFYPKEVPVARWLEHYAQTFDTVELNGTFYRLPGEAAVKGWRERSPPEFRFSAKVSRLITHFRRLRNCEEALDRYLRRIRLLGEKLGPLLYQLPPNFERDLEVLESFLGLLPRDLQHVFEFRNASWWREEVYDLLRRHDASFCIYDMGKTETSVVATSPLVYVRFHGPQAAYSTGYTDAALEDWARRLRKLGGDEAWIYFNNDIDGHAPRDARRLCQLLGAKAQ
jgi:uncharacterized protein YecE (DUF72 family)